MNATPETSEAVSAAGLLSVRCAVQLADLADRASGERVRFYINAARAGTINNRSAVSYFIDRAQRWERVRALAVARLGNDAMARAEGRS